MILLPESKVAFTGDLLFIGIAPVMWPLSTDHKRLLGDLQTRVFLVFFYGSNPRSGPAAAWVKAIDDLLQAFAWALLASIPLAPWSKLLTRGLYRDNGAPAKDIPGCM